MKWHLHDDAKHLLSLVHFLAFPQLVLLSSKACRKKKHEVTQRQMSQDHRFQ